MTGEPRPLYCDHPQCRYIPGTGWSHHPACVVRMIDDTDPQQYAAPLDGPTGYLRWWLRVTT